MNLLEQEYDDFAVFQFSDVMSARMEQKRAEGRCGWYNEDEQINEKLKAGLSLAQGSGRWVDVANYAMMLHWREERGLK